MIDHPNDDVAPPRPNQKGESIQALLSSNLKATKALHDAAPSSSSSSRIFSIHLAAIEGLLRA